VDYQPKRYVLRVQSFRVSTISRSRQGYHSIAVLFDIVDMFGLVRNLRKLVPFQEKPKRVAAIQYANEGMFTIVLNNKQSNSLYANELISLETWVFFTYYYKKCFILYFF